MKRVGVWVTMRIRLTSYMITAVLSILLLVETAYSVPASVSENVIKPMPVIVIKDPKIINITIPEQEPETESEQEEESIVDVSGIPETYISLDAYHACIKYGVEYNLKPEILMAMIEAESDGNASAYNSSSATGIMQVVPKWHYERMTKLNITNLYDTDQNIHVAADYLAELYDRYDSMELALMVYNMGDHKAVKYYDQGKVSRYARGIIDRAVDLERLHNTILEAEK